MVSHDAPTSAADLFDRAGRALFGAQYVAPLAVLLNVDKNTVGKWRDGKSRIPPGVWLDVAGLIQDREQLLPRLKIPVLELANQPLPHDPGPTTNAAGKFPRNMERLPTTPNLPTVVGRSFIESRIANAERRWNETDRAAFQSSLDKLVAARGLRVATVRSDGLQLIVEVEADPLLDGGQVAAYQTWLDAETKRFNSSGAGYSINPYITTNAAGTFAVDSFAPRPPGRRK